MKELVEKLIGRLEEYPTYSFGVSLLNTQEYIKVSDLIEIVNQLAEEYNNGWIACSERLPEIGKWVLGQGVYDMMLVCYTKSYRGDFDWMDINGDCRVISAWQPLPEPFKPIAE